MRLPRKKEDQIYSYRDYCRWPEEERWELIEGKAYNMSPAPTTYHQRLSTLLLYAIHGFLKGKPCETFAAPFDVMLPDSEDQDLGNIINVVQPDIIVVCDKDKLTQRGCLGAPDIAIEILSMHTSKKNHREKFDLYQKHGIKEYWIVDPHGRYVRIFHMSDSGLYDEGSLFEPDALEEEEKTIASTVLEGFRLPTHELFVENSYGKR